VPIVTYVVLFLPAWPHAYYICNFMFTSPAR
jgi:hypothetical protein